MKIECHYCGKEIKEDKKGNIRVAFIPETRMTIDFPICNNICLKKLRLERGYDKPTTRWQKDFIMNQLKRERRKVVQDYNKKIKELKKKK